MKVRCWCGVTTDRPHYPANDPEQGSAHLPDALHPDEEPTDDLPSESMRVLVTQDPLKVWEKLRNQ